MQHLQSLQCNAVHLQQNDATVMTILKHLIYSSDYAKFLSSEFRNAVINYKHVSDIYVNYIPKAKYIQLGKLKRRIHIFANSKYQTSKMRRMESYSIAISME